MSDENKITEGQYQREDITPDDLQEIVVRNQRALYRQIALTHELAAKVDALVAVLGLVAQRTGLDADECQQMWLKMFHHAHQKRLERVEGRNPAAAAAVDTREGMPDILQSLLDEMKYDDEGMSPRL